MAHCSNCSTDHKVDCSCDNKTEAIMSEAGIKTKKKNKLSGPKLRKKIIKFAWGIIALVVIFSMVFAYAAPLTNLFGN